MRKCGLTVFRRRCKDTNGYDSAAVDVLSGIRIRVKEDCVMKEKKISSALLAAAYILSSMLIIAVLALAAVHVISNDKTKNENTKEPSGPNYAVSKLRVWGTDHLPDAAAFLSENAAHKVRSAVYSVMPELKAGDQTVAILLQMEDGTVRTEHAVLSMREPVINLELGDDSATAASLLGSDFTDAVLSQPLSSFTVPGTYPLTVSLKDETIPFTVNVRDTVAPTLKLRSPAQFSKNQDVRPEDFIVECADASSVTYSFNIAPDTTENGTRTASILATDAAGNSQTYEAVYTVTGDGSAPTISGVSDMKTIAKKRINYLRGVKAVDDSDGELEVTVTEPEGFDISKTGTYMISYTATDSAGNIATQTAVLTVVSDEKDVRTLSEEDVYRIGEAMIEDMQMDPELPEEKRARKVYRAVQDSMWFKDNNDEVQWYTAAAIAISRGYGDCRNYYSYAKLLLDCAGFENMQVEHLRTSEKEARHYWNLVKINGEWYHFDTTPRKGRSDFFMLTDAQLDAYSATQSDHIFNRDKSLYPATP